MAELISLKDIAGLLNFSKDEIMELVRQKRIPFLYFQSDDKYLFPKEEILAQIAPKIKESEPVVERRGRRKIQK